MLNKKDPLIESVQKIMKENEIRRTVTANLNEELGIQSINNLPHELHEKYTAILEQNITAALLGEKVEMTKQQFANLDGKPEFTGRDLELVRQGHHKVKAAAGKLEEQDPHGADTTSPSSMGIKKPDYATGTPDYAKNKEQTVNRAEKKTLPVTNMARSENIANQGNSVVTKTGKNSSSVTPSTMKEEQLNELSNQARLNYLGKAAPDSDAIGDMGRSFYRQGKATKILSKYSKGMNRATAALKKRGMSDDQIMSGTAKAASKFAEKEPRKLQKLTEKITAKTDMGSAIKEFKASDSKQLAGRSQEDRRQAAIAAVLQARREKK